MSNTTVSIFFDASSTSPPLTRIPSSAPRPVPTMMAVGVARPNAHGHAMISTATAAVIPATGLAAISVHPAKVATATPMTAGTNTAETRSASRCTGALSPCACSTSRTICASAVSAPTAVARTVNSPSRLTVAPATRSPAVFSTGTDSPVSIDSSTAARPSVTSPSTGIFSPGRTRTRSPTWT
ncbi:Uncharacterised protein [Mycobacterium tuberculosis]|uniref:Uncharacterized protein n=1 Tax=Mycobacterium tuberculosis TaxID=1773 RepID=A0A655FFH3_MYCTX|nr:Uncharacterised protein [Mycobacterium tuberculosis]CFR95047.1 Uncharacterised protein [Mycobacterium tuberculosis]CKU68112.1 Uncharacterised protein [Mycobacterium tuberculosis]CNV65972.1 Uncharacterised protein [Mycobacterium tuberculosis]CNV68959.1 Uncharacterised protein [Mycobacterium tuberculosis]